MTNYVPPELPEDELRFRPRIAREAFTEELEAIINIWTARYPRCFTRYDAILILASLKARLEDEENVDRRRHKSKRKKEPQHGQYTWLEYRQQWVLIDGSEAQRLHTLQEDADRST